MDSGSNTRTTSSDKVLLGKTAGGAEIKEEDFLFWYITEFGERDGTWNGGIINKIHDTTNGMIQFPIVGSGMRMEEIDNLISAGSIKYQNVFVGGDKGRLPNFKIRYLRNNMRYKGNY